MIQAESRSHHKAAIVLEPNLLKFRNLNNMAGRVVVFCVSDT